MIIDDFDDFRRIKGSFAGLKGQGDFSDADRIEFFLDQIWICAPNFFHQQPKRWKVPEQESSSNGI